MKIDRDKAIERATDEVAKERMDAEVQAVRSQLARIETAEAAVASAKKRLAAERKTLADYRKGKCDLPGPMTAAGEWITAHVTVGAPFTVHSGTSQ